MARRLGRGMQAMLGGMDADALAEVGRPALPGRLREPATVALDRLHAGANPRVSFDEAELESLAQSIRDRGIMQPLLVRPSGENFEIIAGERRWRAAQRAGLHEVPVVVREADAAEALELALIENVQRTDLNAIEEARGYRRLMDEFGHKADALGKLIGKSRSHVANLLRLLSLPDPVQAMVVEGRLSPGHARALIGSSDPEALARMVERMGLSVRATEDMVARLERPSRPAKPRREVEDDPNTRALVRRLSDRLGLEVDLAHRKDESGTLTIRYSTLDQLDAVCRLLGED